MSVPLPGEVGDTSSIGFVGYDWATAVSDRLAASATAANSVTTPADFAVMVSSVMVLIFLRQRKYSGRPPRSTPRCATQCHAVAPASLAPDHSSVHNTPDVQMPAEIGTTGKSCRRQR